VPPELWPRVCHPSIDEANESALGLWLNARRRILQRPALPPISWDNDSCWLGDQTRRLFIPNGYGWINSLCLLLSRPLSCSLSFRTSFSLVCRPSIHQPLLSVSRQEGSQKREIRSSQDDNTDLMAHPLGFWSSSIAAAIRATTTRRPVQIEVKCNERANTSNSLRWARVLLPCRRRRAVVISSEGPRRRPRRRRCHY
jgi:hypothetical protein